MTTETIFTLDARDNIYFNVVKDYFGLDENTIHNQIIGIFKDCVSLLDKKKINYQDLKNALIPSMDRNEIALVFDTERIESSWYGFDVFSKIIPLFDKQSCNSVLCGDYIGDDKLQDTLFTEFSNNIKPFKQIEYVHHTQFYIVYINNLSGKMVETFNEGLQPFAPYVGYFDLTYSSYLKTYLSTILIRLFIKNKTVIIAGHEDDKSNEEDDNISGYPFEENGYTCKSIQSIYYSLFLAYKIERKVFEGFESDTSFSINAISENVLDISDFNLLIEEKKLGYLLEEKEENLKRAGIINLTLTELELFVKDKMSDNYIYNLSFLKEYKTTKFNIMVETKRLDTNEFVKLKAVLEYKPTDKTLRLITMF